MHPHELPPKRASLTTAAFVSAAIGLCAVFPSAPVQALTQEQTKLQWPDLSSQVQSQASKTAKADAALVVGIGKYAFVPAVEGAVQNADDWWKYLRQGLGIPRQNIGLLRDDEASAEKIREEARRIAQKAGPGGTIWFIFIGHGVASADGEEGLLVGMDAQGNASSLDARSVRQSEIEGIFRKSKAARTVMLVDSCFSGQTPDGKPLAQGLQALVRTSQAQAQSKTIRLTAGRSDQFAGPLPGAHRPAFSYLVLGALRGWGDADGNGQVSAAEAVDYAGDVLNSLEKGRRQTPELIAPVQEKDRGLVRGASEKGPDIDAMVLAMRQMQAPAPSPAPSSPSPASEPAAEPEKIFIPGGQFTTDADYDIDTSYTFRAAPFWVSKTPVTVDQFAQCAAAGACPASNFKAGAAMKDCNYGVQGRGNHPMNCVDWYAARAYCRWSGGGRLPTHDEWMFAALSQEYGVREMTWYPWGNGRPNKTLMNFDQKRGGPTTTPVGKFSPAGDSPLGVQDMCGNVWEWTSTASGPYYIIKGGAYNSGGMKASTYYMTQASPAKIRADYGFRCVWETERQPPMPPPRRHHHQEPQHPQRWR